jgi:hypothetical protein
MQTSDVLLDAQEHKTRRQSRKNKFVTESKVDQEETQSRPEIVEEAKKGENQPKSKRCEENNENNENTKTAMGKTDKNYEEQDTESSHSEIKDGEDIYQLTDENNEKQNTECSYSEIKDGQDILQFFDGISDSEDEDTGREINEESETNSDNDDSTDFEEDDDTQWPASTIMYLPGVLDEKLLAYFKKYTTKETNQGRIFKPSMTVLIDEENEDEYPEETKEIVDETFRKCYIAKDTHTLQKLYNMMEDSIDEAADTFIEKFNFFNIVSTKEDYIMLKFTPGDFYKEHIECTSLDDDSDGSSRKMCVYLIIEAPEKGGEFEFSYQGAKIKAEAGSILMFPSCPLHPLRVSKVQSGNLVYVNNFLL